MTKQWEKGTIKNISRCNVQWRIPLMRLMSKHTLANLLQIELPTDNATFFVATSSTCIIYFSYRHIHLTAFILVLLWPEIIIAK